MKRQRDEIDRLRADPNTLPLGEIPADWELETLQRVMDDHGHAIWKAVILKQLSGSGCVWKIGYGPTPRQAVLNSIERIGK